VGRHKLDGHGRAGAHAELTRRDLPETLRTADSAGSARVREALGQRVSGVALIVVGPGGFAAPPFVEHLGGRAGFFNVIRLYPSEGVGAVVMGNSTKYDVDAVARLALAFRSAT